MYVANTTDASARVRSVRGSPLFEVIHDGDDGIVAKWLGSAAR